MILATIAGIIAVLAWPAVILTVMLVIKHDVNKLNRQVSRGNSQAHALRNRVLSR